jgi:hypothetical protein
MAEVNCWEHIGCGREPGGSKAVSEGVCPASIEASLDGVNRGENGGRACWVAAGVLSPESIEGSFSLDRLCESCSFYGRVIREEKDAFVFSPGAASTPRRVDARDCVADPSAAWKWCPEFLRRLAR